MYDKFFSLLENVSSPSPPFLLCLLYLKIAVMFSAGYCAEAPTALHGWSRTLQAQRLASLFIITSVLIYIVRGSFWIYLLYSTLLHLPPPQIPLCRRILRSMRLWHWQPDALTIRLDLVHTHSAAWSRGWGLLVVLVYFWASRIRIRNYLYGYGSFHQQARKLRNYSFMTFQ